MTHRICSILILLMGLAANANTLFSQTPAVEVQFFDYADLKPGTLHELVKLTEEILTGVGVSVRVKVCRGSSTVPCEDQTMTTRRLAIRLVAGEARKMSNLSRPPLGQSFADHEGGMCASIFLERVRDVAADGNLSWVRVLAYATVHEVGHLLLGAEAHTERGLMKATWDRKDCEAMSQNHFHFSQEQARQLAARFGASRESQTQGSAAVGSR